jgi:hypothetical protein
MSIRPVRVRPSLARPSWIALLALAAAGAAVVPGARAQLANDECDGALPIDVGVVVGDTDAATDSPTTGSCASFGGFTGSDVWFTYTAPESGLLSLSLVSGGGFADFDTMLAAFSGPCGALVEEACNDDAAPFVFQSKLAVLVAQGQEYHVEVGGWNGSSGHFELAVTFFPEAVPANDTCSTAQPIGDGLVSGTTFFATTAPTTPGCAAFGAPVVNDVWFLYVAPTDGFLRASLVADGGFADFDTVMSAFTGQCGQLVEVACNDDGPGSLASDLVFAVTAGTSYRLELGGWNGAVGEFTLSVGYVTLPPNDECAGALPVGPGLIRGTTGLATASPTTADCGFEGAPTGADLWFDFTAPGAGKLTVSTSFDSGGFANFDTVLAAFTGECESLDEIACNDDAGLTVLSEIAFPVEPGQTYHIALGGFDGASGDFGLNLALQVQGPTPDVVIAHAKISDTEGGFRGDLSQGFGSFGFGVAALGDLDGDGTGDLAVGSPFEDLAAPDAGALWLLFLNGDGSVKSHVRLSAGAGGLGFATGQTEFGSAVAPLGDLDADGVPDVAVGADLDDDGGPDRGAVWVLFLNGDGSVKAHAKISDTEGGFGGVFKDEDGFGRSLARLGDLDGDGTTELAVGAPNYPDGGPGRGAAWVLFLNPDGTVKDWQRISNTIGGFAGVITNQDHFGTSVAGLGDIDLDGVPDLAVGAPGDDTGGDDNGAVWVLRLLPDGKVAHTAKLAAGVNGFDGELFGGVLLGTGMAALADADGDGRSELAVGAISDPDGGPFHGAVWLIFLDELGHARRVSKISSTHGGFAGVLGDGAFFGEALADLGDLDGDGLGDLAVGNRFDDDGANDRGAVWILFLDAANAWIDLGQGLAGALGEPRLEGEGSLAGDTQLTLTVTRAATNAVAAAFMGASLGALPFHGGVLVPAADVVAWPLVTDASGSLVVDGRWPVGLPAGLPFWFQVWLFDPAGPGGYAATNALTIETP